MFDSRAQLTTHANSPLIMGSALHADQLHQPGHAWL